MRLPLIAFLVIGCAAAEPGASAAPASVVGCDSLITLRRLMMQGPESGPVPPEFAGCREIPAAKIGDVEKRAMIGDAPFECHATGEGPCLWVRP